MVGVTLGRVMGARDVTIRARVGDRVISARINLVMVRLRARPISDQQPISDRHRLRRRARDLRWQVVPSLLISVVVVVVVDLRTRQPRT